MTVQLKELREEQARIATNARAKFDEIKDDTAEERAQEIEREFDAMMADHDKLNSKAERLEKLDTIERQMNEADSRRPSGKAEGRGVADEDLPTYREAFANMLRSKVPDTILTKAKRSRCLGSILA